MKRSFALLGVIVLLAVTFSFLASAGTGTQEAFQLLWNASAIFYGLTYLVMFAIPLIGLRDRAVVVAVAVAAAGESGAHEDARPAERTQQNGRQTIVRGAHACSTPWR